MERLTNLDKLFDRMRNKYQVFNVQIDHEILTFLVYAKKLISGDWKLLLLENYSMKLVIRSDRYDKVFFLPLKKIRNICRTTPLFGTATCSSYKWLSGRIEPTTTHANSSCAIMSKYMFLTKHNQYRTVLVHIMFYHHCNNQ